MSAAEPLSLTSDAWDAPARERVRMCLAEAGYPNAEVSWWGISPGEEWTVESAQAAHRAMVVAGFRLGCWSCHAATLNDCAMTTFLTTCEHMDGGAP